MIKSYYKFKKTRKKKARKNIKYHGSDDDDDDDDDVDPNIDEDGNNRCGEGYTGSYAYNDQTCPCGKFRQGMCASGVVIPLWTSANIDDFIAKWAANVAFDEDYAEFKKSNPIEKGEFKNMYYIGDLDELMDDEVEECVATCKVNLKVNFIYERMIVKLILNFQG